MSHRFLISGLPRSRTAWFSVATTTPISICCHEPTPTLQSFQALVEYWKTDPKIAVGISDSSLAPQLGRILAELAPRTLIIRRDPETVMDSFAAYIKPSGIAPNELESRRLFKLSLAAMAEYSTHELVKVVDYESLNDYAMMRDALQWLVPSWDFPDLLPLMDMNIQLRLDRALKIAGAPHSRWHLKDTGHEAFS